jgi:hypothetical protein
MIEFVIALIVFVPCILYVIWAVAEMFKRRAGK